MTRSSDKLKAIFCIRSDGLYLDRFKTHLESLKKQAETIVLRNFKDITRLVEENPVVLLVTVRSTDDIRELISVMGMHAKAISSRSFIVVVIQTGMKEKIEQMIIKGGAKEVLLDRADLRAVEQKVARYLKISESNFAEASEQEIAKVFQGTAPKPTNVEQLANELVTLVDPLFLTFDYWIVNNKRAAQRNMGRWIVTVIGPSPSIGTWMTDPKSGRRFIFKLHTNEFHSSNGNWVFYGSKPEFSFEIGKWNFVGADPRLEWVDQNGTSVAVRFWVNPESRKLMLAPNSEKTMAWLPKIEATFDRDYRFKEESIHFQEYKNEINAAQSRELEMKTEALTKDIPGEIVKFLKDVRPQYSSKSNIFNRVDDPVQIRKFFQVAAQYEDRGILWLSDRIFITDLRVYNLNLAENFVEVFFIPPRVDPLALIDEAIAHGAEKKIYLNFKLLETSLFFFVSREQITMEDGLLRIPFPPSAYEVQRREGIRLKNSPPIPGLVLKKIPPTAKGDWAIIDISPKGIGLEMNADSFSFEQDRAFKIELSLQNVDLTLMCIPRWFKPSTNGKLRMGARFQHLSDTALENLELYIMQKNLERIRYGADS